MPTIYEQRSLNCGRHGHEKTECEKPQRQREPYEVKHNHINTQNNDVTQRCNILYEKEEVGTEIKAEEKLDELSKD